MDELRIVARYAVQAAADVLVVYENSELGDERPRNAVSAAWTFVNGAPRSNLQRAASLDAHRAAKEVSSEAARRAAQAAGDAAAAPIFTPWRNQPRWAIFCGQRRTRHESRSLKPAAIPQRHNTRSDALSTEPRQL